MARAKDSEGQDSEGQDSEGRQDAVTQLIQCEGEDAVSQPHTSILAFSTTAEPDALYDEAWPHVAARLPFRDVRRLTATCCQLWRLRRALLRAARPLPNRAPGALLRRWLKMHRPEGPPPGHVLRRSPWYDKYVLGITRPPRPADPNGAPVSEVCARVGRAGGKTLITCLRLPAEEAAFGNIRDDTLLQRVLAGVPGKRDAALAADDDAAHAVARALLPLTQAQRLAALAALARHLPLLSRRAQCAVLLHALPYTSPSVLRAMVLEEGHSFGAWLREDDCFDGVLRPMQLACLLDGLRPNHGLRRAAATATPQDLRAVASAVEYAVAGGIIWSGGTRNYRRTLVPADVIPLARAGLLRALSPSPLLADAASTSQTQPLWVDTFTRATADGGLGWDARDLENQPLQRFRYVMQIMWWDDGADDDPRRRIVAQADPLLLLGSRERVSHLLRAADTGALKALALRAPARLAEVLCSPTSDKDGHGCPSVLDEARLRGWLTTKVCRALARSRRMRLQLGERWWEK